MKITKIELAGENKTVAIISRRIGAKVIIAWIGSPGNPDGEDFSIRADNRDEQYEMARRLQLHLDGGRGTNSMIHGYFRIIQQLAD